MARLKKKKVKDNRPFSERHPKLNVLLGLFMLICFAAGAISIAYWVVEGLVVLIKKLGVALSEVTSSMDAVVIVALITGTVSIVGVIISSVVAKLIEYRKNRQDYLAKKREEPYGEFVEMVYKIHWNGKVPGSYPQEVMIDDLIKFSKKITLWGSPAVANKWVEFRENTMNSKSGTENLFLMEEIMNEMRKDLGMKKVKKGNLLGFFINDIKETMKAVKKMTPEVKDRIEQLRHGNVPEGYKKTKYGVCPKEWEQHNLGTLGTTKNGLNFHRDDSGCKLRVLGVGDFKELSILRDTNTLTEISLNMLPDEESFLRDGDIVFVRSNGSKELVC